MARAYARVVRSGKFGHRVAYTPNMPVCASCGETNPARARFCMTCAAFLPASVPMSGDARKVVTVLFCDVVGSTPLGERLEPEAVRKVMTRFFDEMRAVLERHGGTVEKYIGDAVVAFFGTPVLHEDDAVRAVRAAAEMQAALVAMDAELERTWGVSLRSRIGINTGEVVVSDAASGGAIVVSDAVNVAARLEQTAAPGEILLGPDTYALVRGVVTVDEGRALSLKGKADPVMGFRLLTVEPGSDMGHRATPAFVGRADEFMALQRAFERSAAERRCVLLTVLGAAGVGKSRLADEFAAHLGADVRVARGRCLPYGDGITFWPVAELVKDACGIEADDTRDAARAKIAATLEGAEGADVIAGRVAAVSGFGESSGAVEETFWAIRRFLECLQSESPLVVLFDDIQWAEPTFLDLLEYLAGWSRDASILLLCLARIDLLDVRPSWTSTLNTDRALLLSPLSQRESEELIGNLLGASPLDPSDASRIIEAAEGNPLFVEEMLRMLEDDGVLTHVDGHWTVATDLSQVAVPVTIQAVLAARLDRLASEEKVVLGSAAVTGKEFWWGAVADLVPEALRPQVGGHLQTLVRKGLILPERSTLPGEDAFRFHHLLVQEAAYQGLPKERRAELHERFAHWIEAHSGDRVLEYEEVVGYHLEQSYRYRIELGSSAAHPGVHDLAVRAAERLTATGRRARSRGDMAAAANLLERAAALHTPGDPDRLALLPDLSETLMETGDLTRAGSLLEEALEGARVVGDRGLEGHAMIVRMLLMGSTDPKGRSEMALRELERLIPVFEELDDRLGLARAWRLTADLRWAQERYAAVDEALERAIEHARAAGASWVEAESQGYYTGSAVYGPTPVPQAVARCEQILTESRSNRLVEALAKRSLAALRAMQGRFDEGRGLAMDAAGILEDLGLWLRAAFVWETIAFVERLAGDAEASERALRTGYELSEKLGEQGFLSTVSALLAKAMLDRDRLEEADRFLAVSAEAAAEDDLATQVALHGARGRAWAARGDLHAAETSCREAVALADTTDDLNMRAEALQDLGAVLDLSGRVDDARQVLNGSLELFVAKGNGVSADAVRELIGRLG
jgi:predicted ATPase/class 3 adenylate cyclase